MTDIKPLISPWVPETHIETQKRLGKALEEGGEYVSAVARCLIQGINEREPVTGKPNRQWLMEEMADVLATLSLLIEGFKLNKAFISKRVEKKREQLKTWFAMDPGIYPCDKYGNPIDGDRVINCCFPDCGCPETRLCQAENGWPH